MLGIISFPIVTVKPIQMIGMKARQEIPKHRHFSKELNDPPKCFFGELSFNESTKMFEKESGLYGYYDQN